jgi:hypothetical protein
MKSIPDSQKIAATMTTLALAMANATARLMPPSGR